MKLHPFVATVAALSFENCFNPYSDRCQIHDRADAPQRRAKLLSALITEAQSTEIDAIWVGRDLGYRGGRRTGLALTDDVHVDRHLERWGLSSARPTKGEMVAERTAAVIWQMLDRIDVRVFLWNVFPLHPYEIGNPFSNRQHNVHERRAGEEVLKELVSLLMPKRIVCIGNNALASVSRLGYSLPIVQVRHPSYGGQTDFMEKIGTLYDIRSLRQSDLF